MTETSEKSLKDLSPALIATAVNRALAELLGVKEENLSSQVLGLAFEADLKADACELTLLVQKTYDSFAGYGPGA